MKLCLSRLSYHLYRLESGAQIQTTKMPRLFDNSAIFFIVGILALSYFMFNGADESYGPIPDAYKNIYRLSFRSESKPTTAHEWAIYHENAKDLLSSYLTFVELDLGNEVLKKFNATESGVYVLVVRLEETAQLMKASRAVKGWSKMSHRDLCSRKFLEFKSEDCRKMKVMFVFGECHWPFIQSEVDPETCVKFGYE